MIKKKHVFSCPVGGTLEVFAGRWKPEILWHLKEGTMRFNQLKRAIGSASQKMLTQQLRELERDGLVNRKQYEEIPPRVEYTSTELALSLSPLFADIVKWRDEHIDAVHMAQKKYDRMKK